jgi:hypothetical protein
VPEENGGDSRMTLQVEAQVGYIQDQFVEKTGTQILVAPKGDGVDFMYAAGQLLVLDAYLDRVLHVLLGAGLVTQPYVDQVLAVESGEPIEPGQPVMVRVIRGVVLLLLQPLHPGDPLPAVLDALQAIDERLGSGVATPNHVLTVAPDGGPCPATEPEQAYDETEPYPGICHSNSGAGVRVYIADTGLLAAYLPGATRVPGEHNCPWLRGVEGAPDEALGTGADGGPTIPLYVGHGTFVAGVVRCMAPEAEIYVANPFQVAGSQFESNLVRELDAALRCHMDIFHLSVATTTRHNLPLIGVERWLEELRHYKGAVCVVAAGNNGSSRQCWPAASPGTVSVGALGADWRGRARFSNHGSWVDVYAPGRDLVNAFATGTYTCQWPPYAPNERQFYGMAKWSGTSFSTPVVTGLIADRMSRTGENGREAAEALLAEARHQAIAGVGAILLPCRGGACRDDCSRCHPVGAACGRKYP